MRLHCCRREDEWPAGAGCVPSWRTWRTGQEQPESWAELCSVRTIDTHLSASAAGAAQRATEHKEVDTVECTWKWNHAIVLYAFGSSTVLPLSSPSVPSEGPHPNTGVESPVYCVPIRGDLTSRQPESRLLLIRVCRAEQSRANARSREEEEKRWYPR